MKKGIILLVMIGMATFASAQTKLLYAKLKKEEIPTEIITAITEDFPDEMVTEYYGIPVTIMEDAWFVNIYEDPVNEDYDSYTFRLKGKKAEFTATYDKTGKLLYSYEKLLDAPLPHPIQKSLAINFEGWTVSKDKILITHYNKVKQKAHYIVDLTKGKDHHRVIFDASGNIIKGQEKATHKGMWKKHEDKTKGKMMKKESGQ